MNEQPITAGRIVHYRLSYQDAQAANRRRKDAMTSGLLNANTGAILHYGASVSEGMVFPMMVTAVWSADEVNGQVFLDGNDTIWVTRVAFGQADGQWRWPERV